MIKLIGKEISKNILDKINNNKNKDILEFQIFLDTNDLSTKSYVKSICRTLDKVNIKYSVIENKTLEENLSLLQNKKMSIIARPHKFEKELVSNIDSNFDPDMLSENNMGKLYSGDLNYLPATARSFKTIIDEYDIDLKGKKVLVLGRSISVGLPIFMCCQRKHATCTLAHSQTKKDVLDDFIKNSDVLVLCTGKSGLINRNLLNKNQIIIDCGYSPNGGDLGFIPEEDEVNMYTPVPGGIGPLTIVSLISNALFLQSINKE